MRYWLVVFSRSCLFAVLASSSLAVFPSCRLAVYSRPPTSDSQLQPEVDDAVRDECPQGGGDDSDEEQDEQQRLPNVTAAALLRGAHRDRRRRWLSRCRFRLTLRFRSMYGIGFRR